MGLGCRVVGFLVRCKLESLVRGVGFGGDIKHRVGRVDTEFGL